MRICCLNNYPLEKMVRLAGRGLMPGQHGWGLQRLCDAGHEILIAPHADPSRQNLLDRTSGASRQVFGQLDQQIWSLRRRPDLFYSADQQSLAGVAMARGVLARCARLISVAHHPLLGRGARVRFPALRAHDAVVTISQPVCDQLRSHGVRARFIPWGPDLRCDLYAASRDNGFAVSTGKSNRDIPTLVRALARTGLEGRIFDLHRTTAQAPPNVVVVHPGGEGADPHSKTGYLAQTVLDMTCTAGFVAIPIADPNRLTGLTEINDALALGKPIVITRSPFTPVDVEAVGCGIVVEAGDVEGWVAAIETMRDPEVRREMGERGRRFAESSWNYEIFGSELLKLVSEVAD